MSSAIQRTQSLASQPSRSGYDSWSRLPHVLPRKHRHATSQAERCRRGAPFCATPDEPRGPEQQAAADSGSSQDTPDTGPTQGVRSDGAAPASATTAQLLQGEDRKLQIPKEVIEQLKYTVFGFDTFWVTSVENYEADGVVFKGNLRGKDVGASYLKMKERMKNILGDRYQLFLLQDKEDKPTAIVLPSEAREGTLPKLTEVWLAITFATFTAITTFTANGVPLLQFLVDPFRTAVAQEDFVSALPGVLAFWFILGAHEFGHQWAAKQRGVELYLPFIVPAGFGFIGSFGGVTRFKGFVPNRETLLDVAARGPAVGALTSLAFVLAGFALTAAGVTDVGVDSPSFADSFLIAVAAQAFLGDALAQPVVEVNSLLLAGWAGLVVNALNCIPTGELDGGRIVLGLWGRGVARLLGVLSLGALGITSFNNALAFYWVLLVLVLQRGPILPGQEELSVPTDEKNKLIGKCLLVLPLLMLLPFPIELAKAIQDMQNPTPF